MNELYVIYRYFEESDLTSNKINYYRVEIVFSNSGDRSQSPLEEHLLKKDGHFVFQSMADFKESLTNLAEKKGLSKISYIETKDFNLGLEMVSNSQEIKGLFKQYGKVLEFKKSGGVLSKFFT